MAGCDFSRLPGLFITHPEGIANSVSQQFGWGYRFNAFAARKAGSP
jgi:hypothetical protein